MKIDEMVDKVFEEAQAKNINNYEIAEHLDVTDVVVSRWRTKKRKPTLAHLVDMADYVGLELKVC